MKLHLSINKSLRHIGYWLGLVLFFTFVWGTYDDDYWRNFYIQLFSLPARITLVYVSILYLFPRFLLQKEYFMFILLWLLLLIGVSVFIQRPIMMYYVQPNYLPSWNNDNFFVVSEMMNTILDVNLAAIVPCGYVLFRVWKKTEQKANKLSEQKASLSENDFYFLKVEKTLLKVLLKDIVFIEALKNYVKIKTVEREIVAYRSILSMEHSLPSEKFLRVHRSFIVSIDHVENFSPTKLEIKGRVIPIGRKYKEVVKATLGYF